MRTPSYVAVTTEIYRQAIDDYYKNNFKLKTQKGETPAPCNLHPLKYDFFMMKPQLIFRAEINSDNVEIKFWDLDNPKAQPMPTMLLSKDKLTEIFGKEVWRLKKEEIFRKHPFVSTEELENLKMKIKKLKSYKEKYQRR